MLFLFLFWARGECLREGCTTPAQTKGRVCFKHGVKVSCADPDCDTPQVRGRFVCLKHGAYGYCTTDACINNASTMRGKCKKHDSKTVACSAEGCWSTWDVQQTWRARRLRSTSAPLPSLHEAGAQKARQRQQESVQGERPHHTCASTWRQC